jgi:hypothetical protein
VAHKAGVQPIVSQTPQNLVQQRIHASSLKDLAELMREIHWGHRLSPHHAVIMQLLKQPAGKYSEDRASTVCTNCKAAGKYKASAGVNTACENCEAPCSSLCGANFAVKDGLDGASFQLGVAPESAHWNLAKLLPRLFMLAE